ncbi:DNA methyltransferase [Photobacterium damselae]|uniref:DNA methyltransferase n=1 Tax=Photobacterium damselae TaxID=38293 RepID=UPI003D7D29FE
MFNNINLNQSLSSSLVNIDEKTRSNLFSWRGQFSPQLVEQLILNYATENDVIFDPFLGSGTVLYESAQLGLTAYGSEINPAAVAFSKVYELANHPRHEVNKALTQTNALIAPYLYNEDVLDKMEEALLEKLHSVNCVVYKTLLMALITSMDFGTKKLTLKRACSVWDSLHTTVSSLPETNNRLTCYQADSRRVPLAENAIDFVITSPPYINVFNYHQNYRKVVEKTGVDVLKVAKSEIGANRKFRQNRFLTVVQYCMDMSQVFTELYRVCKSDAKVIFIVGRESNVKRTAFKNAELITAVAQITGFNLEGEQHRVFKNKFGEDIYEEILRFSLNDVVAKDTTEQAREIGRSALQKSLQYCGSEVASEITEAIEKSKFINVSPYLEV